MMQVSLDQSYFGRISSEDKLSKKKMRKIVRKYAFQIIEYCRKESKKMKKRNQYQTILFPTDYEYEESDDISHTLMQEHKQHADYPFYLTQCQLFIDNYHLKILKKASPLPIKFANIGYGKLRQFASWVQRPQKNMLIGVTSLHIILIISVSEKLFYKYRIQGKRKQDIFPLVNASVHKEFLFAFSQQQCHICKYQNLKNPQKGLEKLIQKVVTQKQITRGEGIEREGKFYIFMLIENTLVMQRLQVGILLSKIDYKNKILHECRKSLVNLVIYPKRTNGVLTHVIIAIATEDEVKLICYSFESDTPTVFANKENPVIDFRKQAWPSFLQFIERETYLLCAIGFKNRLYFGKIQEDYCEFSRRIKFEHPIQYVNELGSSCGIVIVTNLIKDGKNNRKIYVTHEEKLISYSQYVFTQLVDKFQITFQSQISTQILPLSSNKAIYLYDKREIFLLGDGQIQRVVLNTWEGIYSQMKLTQNIKLLKFLILLKHIPSPFLQAPSSFDGFERFFPSDTNESKQILLQYYYHMDMEPSLVDISINCPIMIPFILAHQISNLSDKALQQLLTWCLTFDERLVQEMIIGGSDCGWEIAVSRGWIRAFKVMVERGMELEMPILKLFALAHNQRKMVKDQSTQQQVQSLTPLGEKFLNQMIEYTLFILGNFFQDVSGNGSNVQFRNILSIILKQDLWSFMIRFSPIRAISLISSIFCSQGRIKEINRYSPVDFIHFHKQFRGMTFAKGRSNSEIVAAHISSAYESVADADDFEFLHMEHAKLMILRYQEDMKAKIGGTVGFKETLKSYEIFLNEPFYDFIYMGELERLRERFRPKVHFQFKKDYEVQILKALIKDQGKNLEQVYFSARTSSTSSRTYEEVQCQMFDFLVFLWQEIYFKLVDQILLERSCEDQRCELEERDRNIKSDVKIAVRKILAEVEGSSHQEQFLSIHLLLATNSDGENSSKIFGKFLSSKNAIIRQRVFTWLKMALGSSSILQQQLIMRLKDLIAINHEESRALLQNFYEGRQKQIIKKIDHDPHLQLEYLQLIIKNANEQLELYYTNLHMQLVLKLKPDKLIEVLETNNQMVEYDISEALKMTLAAHDFDRKDDTLIYLYEREGELAQCISTYLTTFEILVFSYIALYERGRGDDDQAPNLNLSMTFLAMAVSESEGQRKKLVVQIDRKFDDSIRLLFRIPQRNYDHLVCYLRKLNSIWKGIVSRDYKFKTHYLQFITAYFGRFLVQLFQRNCLLQLAMWLEQARADLLQFLLQMKGYLVQGYDQMLIQLVILRSMAKMEKTMLLRQIKQAVIKLEFCISSAAYCFVCDRQFGEEYSADGLLFNCGHIYHKGCIDQVNDQDFCYQCVSKNQYKSMIQNDSLFLVELLRKFRQKRKQKKNEEQIRVQGRKKDMLISLAKKRTNRLALYDKKATAIENQAEIIDIKLLIQEYYSTQAKR